MKTVEAGGARRAEERDHRQVHGEREQRRRHRPAAEEEDAPVHDPEQEHEDEGALPVPGERHHRAGDDGVERHLPVGERGEHAPPVERHREGERDDVGEEDEPEERRGRLAHQARTLQVAMAVPPSSTVTVTRRKSVSQTSLRKSSARSARPSTYLMLPAMLKIGRYIAMMKTADHAAEEHHHDRLDHARQRADRDVDLVFVEVGDLVEHRVHGAGLLADADHLHDHRREDLGLGERARPCSCPRRSWPGRT